MSEPGEWQRLQGRVDAAESRAAEMECRYDEVTITMRDQLAAKVAELAGLRAELQEPEPGEARDMLERYLARSGLARSTDVAQQFQVTLIRQWTEHLDEVLEANHVEPGLRHRIIREFIYGVTPQEAEAQIREHLVQEMTELRAGGPFPYPPLPPDEPGWGIG